MRSRPVLPLLPLLLGLLALLVVGACSWAVPADPGRNARLRARTEAPAGARPVQLPAAEDAATRSLYEQRCGRCHAPFPPSHLPAARWPTFVAKYAPRAGLFGADRERVLAWLQANAGG